MYLAPLLIVASMLNAQEPTLRVESLQVVQPERTLQGVTVVIRNLTSETQSGFVWFVLASPTEPEPWRVHDYASRERPIRLNPGRIATVEFAGPDEPLDGQFALSVWLHGVGQETSGRFHSDMRAHDLPVVIAPPFSFSVDYLVGPSSGADVDGDEGDMNVLVRFAVRNNQVQTANVGLDYRITSAEENPEPDRRKLARTAEIAQGVDYVVTVRHEQPLPREKLKLTGWIYELVDGRLLYRGTDVTPIDPKD